MQTSVFVICGVAIAVSIGAGPRRCTANELTVESKPNILIILADDLGYSDPGCYGGEIKTPVLNRLAKNGVRFTNFYNTGRCWPTRSSLLTGYYAQQVGRDRLPGRKQGGARNRRPAWSQLLPELLQKHGYRTYHSGKWHIDATPLKGGFDRSYWTPDHGRFFSPRRHLEDDVLLQPVKRGTGYYTTIATADHAIRCLTDHTKNYPDQPFFSYVAFIAPHFPLHALPEDIQEYQNAYQSGWDDVRKKRWQRMRQMGLVPGELSNVEYEIGPPYDFPKALKQFGAGEMNRPQRWAEMNETQRKFQQAKMSIHAAMVHRMDLEIGRLVNRLAESSLLDNTLILFLSDNGASAEIMIRDDGHDPNAEPGSADTHLCLGPGWSTVSNTPFRRHKTWVHEGGISTPLIAHWPNGIHKKDVLCHSPAHVIDIAPTILEIVGHESSHSQGPRRPGRSLVPEITRTVSNLDKSHERTIWWYHEGNRALRQGDWKLVSAKNSEWELFDLSKDRCETRNLIAEKPELAKSLQRKWNSMTSQFKAQAAKDYDQSE